jgi:predicted DNA-binding transcriptional regulator YafY
MENLQETRRMARLLKLVQYIANAPRQWTRQRLAAHFEVSERQITKDLELLRQGLHLDARHARNGYYFEHVPRLPTVAFSFEEALALLLAVQAGSGLVGVDTAALAAAVGRLGSLFPIDLRPIVRAADTVTMTATNRATLLALLQRAIGQCRQVWLEYHAASRGGAISQRAIDPYAIVPYGKSWHLIGYCHLREAIRLFKLDRVRQARLLDATFPWPADFDLTRYLNDGWGLMRGLDGLPEEVTLRFRSPSATFVAEETWHSSQQLEWQASGSLLFRVTVVVTPELRRWVFRYGRDVEVLAPEHLRIWMADEAHGVMEQASATAVSLSL